VFDLKAAGVLLGQWWLGLGQNDLFLLMLLDFDLSHFVHHRLDTACVDSIELPPHSGVNN